MNNIDAKEILSASMVLFAIMDMIGNIPVVLIMKKKLGYINSFRTSLVCFVLMVLFLLFGDKLLSLIGISVYDFAVAGALIIFFIALEMILGVQLYKHKVTTSSSASVFIAFPIIVGPGTLTSLLSLRAEYATINILIGIIINLIIVFFVLKYSSKIGKALGPDGIEIVKRIFGVILLAISIKLFTSNVKELF